MPAPEEDSSLDPEEPIPLEIADDLPVAQIYDGEAPAEDIVLEIVPNSFQQQPESSSTLVTTREVVLVGAGRAHLQVVNWWRKNPVPNARLTLVSAFARAAVGNSLADVVAGRIEPEEILIDLPELCARSHVHLIVDRAIRFDPAAQQIELAHQPSLRFDVASINIGSVPTQEALWQTYRMLVSVKPLATFWQRFQARQQELLTQWREADVPKRLQFAIVGAGTTGVELALGLEEQIHNNDLPIDVHLVDGNAEVWSKASAGAIRRVRKLLEYRGITLHLGQRVVDCEQDGRSALIREDGSPLRCDLAIWATSASPPAVLKGFQLPLSDRGFLLADRALRVSREPAVFAAGDAADFPTAVAKSLTNTDRQGSVLWHNLRAVLNDEPLKVFTPAPNRLTFLTCGDGSAIVDYQGWSLRSQWAWWWKRCCDRASIQRLR